METCTSEAYQLKIESGKLKIGDPKSLKGLQEKV